MKKAIVLSMVLSVAQMACAWLDIPGLSYEVQGNTLIFSAENCTGFSFQLMPSTGNGNDLFNDVIAAGFTTANHGVPYGSYGFIGVGASTGASAPITGVIYSVDFGPGVMNLEFIYSPLAGGSDINLDGQVINLEGYSLVPEPVTLALLGLGGLFLTRQRQ